MKTLKEARPGERVLWAWRANISAPLQLEIPYLFELEDVLIEIILQLLVGVVYAELLKAVGVEVLKAKDVEHPDGKALHSEKEGGRSEGKEGGVRRTAGQPLLKSPVIFADCKWQERPCSLVCNCGRESARAGQYIDVSSQTNLKSVS